MEKHKAKDLLMEKRKAKDPLMAKRKAKDLLMEKQKERHLSTMVRSPRLLPGKSRNQHFSARHCCRLSKARQ